MAMIASFFVGALACNAIPHLCAGLQGQVFPTPFAKPSGEGDSSALVNVLWGSVNAVACAALLAARPFALGANIASLAFFVGALAIGVFAAWHFGKVRAARL
jgi:hypothetical protein